MRRLVVSAFIVLSVLTLGIVPSSAGNPQDTMAIDPTSGPPGTEISVTGTGCVTKGDVEVVVDLLDTSDVVQDSETVTPTFEGFSGDWEATLTVPADSTDFGEWTVEAVCRIVVIEDAAAPAGLQFLIDYIPRPFTVTEPAQEPPPAEPPAAEPVDAVPDFTG